MEEALSAWGSLLGSLVIGFLIGWVFGDFWHNVFGSSTKKRKK